MIFKLTAEGKQAGTLVEHNNGFNILTLSRCNKEVLDQAEKFLKVRERKVLLIHVEDDLKLSDTSLLANHGIMNEKKVVVATKDQELAKVLEGKVDKVTNSITYGTGYANKL